MYTCNYRVSIDIHIYEDRLRAFHWLHTHLGGRGMGGQASKSFPLRIRPLYAKRGGGVQNSIYTFAYVIN